MNKSKWACFADHLGERTVRIREVRGFDPLRVHHSDVLYHRFSHGLRTGGSNMAVPLVRGRAHAGEAGPHQGQVWVGGIRIFHRLLVPVEMMYSFSL